MKLKILFVFCLLLIAAPAVSALTFTGNLTSYVSTSDVIVNTPYLDYNIWLPITLLGLGFLILSNLVSAEQAATLWAIVAPLFLVPSAYFALQLRQSELVTQLSGADITTHVVNVVTHPEWLCFLMSIITLISFINIWMVATKKPVEKTNKKDILGEGRI